MDSDARLSDDEIFDSDHNSFESRPIPTTSQSEIEGVESFYKCFIDRFDACPTFFMGSLQEACQSGLNLPIIEDRRPILVYIHHGRSLLSNIFCSSIFCSETIINYLHENYIVWPWDITHESNEKTFINIWKRLSTEFIVDISVEQCPMLIGIMKRSTGEKGWLSSCDYECTLIQQSDTLPRIGVKLNLERLLNELTIFKEQCDKNEQVLAFDFFRKTRLPCEIFFEITKYFYLNEIIYAFSSNILPILNKYNVKLHLSDPSDKFINLISEHIKQEHIVSVRRNMNGYKYKTTFTPSVILDNIIALSFVNLVHGISLRTCATHYRNLMFLSLRFTNTTNYSLISNILSKLENPIKRFELHCEKIIDTHEDMNLSRPSFLRNKRFKYMNLSYSSFLQNKTIEYILLNIDYSNLNAMNYFTEGYDHCFLSKTIDFIKCIINVQCVHFMINCRSLISFLDQNGWENLMKECDQLRKIIIQRTGQWFEDEQRTKKLLKIQKDLRLRDFLGNKIKIQLI